MTKQEHITYWITTAQHDLETAEALLKAERNDACLFFGHLALEKILKALWVKSREEGFIPPKSHNLLKIASEARLVLTGEQSAFLGLAEGFNLETRYPDYRLSFYKLCTKEFASTNMGKIRELFKCLLVQAQ